MFIDARKAHLNPRCEVDEYIELPMECGAGEGVCGKLNYWLYGFRPAASAWEKHYSALFEGVGFERGRSCGLCFIMRGGIYHWRFMGMILHFVDWEMI